jgi:ribosomal protein S18 acetylase RimI-like enzyme
VDRDTLTAQLLAVYQFSSAPNPGFERDVFCAQSSRASPAPVTVREVSSGKRASFRPRMAGSLMKQLLENIVWHTLSGPQSRFASGAGAARRYAAGFSPIVGFADPADPDFDALVPYCAPGEHFYCDGWFGPVPAAWQLQAETTMFKMTWDGPAPAVPAACDMVALGPAHAAAALELATLTRPGPFGLRTIELGEYLGIFDGGRLVAMAGERMQAERLREISGVCTHPDFQGRGYARRLMFELIGRQLRRAETPFLHVMRENRGAHDLYERMGFTDYKESVVRVVSLR